MIAVFFLLLICALSDANTKALPSSMEIEGSINRTIGEVERLIDKNPSLPRLTRQDIVDILHNITSKDIDSYEDEETMEKARKMYQRALMIVLPYNAKESAESLKDLYTKPPMVQIISDSSSRERLEMVIENRTNEEILASHDNTSNRIVDSESIEESSIDEQLQSDGISEEDDVSSKSMISRENPSNREENRFKNHRETYSDVYSLKISSNENLTPGPSPLKFSFNLENLQKNRFSTEKPYLTDQQPIFLEGTTTRERENVDPSNVKLEVVYGRKSNIQPTTPVTLDSSKDTKESSIDPTKSNPFASKKIKENVLSSDQWRYNAPPSIITRNSMTSFKSIDDALGKQSKRPIFYPTPVAKISTLGNTRSELDAEVETLPSYFVTPLSTESKKSKETSKSQGTGTKGDGFMRQEVMDLLDSIGLRSENNSSIENAYEENRKLYEAKLQIPDTNSIVYPTISNLGSADVVGSSIVDQNTFDNAALDLKKGMQNLTPDVQLLFQRFGLQTSLNLAEPVELTKTSTASSLLLRQSTSPLNSYVSFKPLSISKVKDREMKEFLARFGLGTNDSREQKSMRQSTERPSLIDAVPVNMRNVLENIGLISNSRTKVSDTKEDMEETESSKFHVFKPHETIVKDEGQKLKINELLETVKLVQEGKADPKDVQKIANDLLKTTKTLKDGPNLLNLEEIIRIYNQDLRNEVKREQQETLVNEELSSTMSSIESPSTSEVSTDALKEASNLDVSTAASSGSTTSTTSITTTTAASTTSNIVALEESFGGSTSAPDPALPTRKKTGLYFLVDWNTFLEVGEEGGEKVNLRFQPKVGDRSRFISVTVP